MTHRNVCVCGRAIKDASLANVTICTLCVLLSLLSQTFGRERGPTHRFSQTGPTHLWSLSVNGFSTHDRRGPKDLDFLSPSPLFCPVRVRSFAQVPVLSVKGGIEEAPCQGRRRGAPRKEKSGRVGRLKTVGIRTKRAERKVVKRHTGSANRLGSSSGLDPRPSLPVPDGLRGRASQTLSPSSKPGSSREVCGPGRPPALVASVRGERRPTRERRGVDGRPAPSYA